MANSTNGVHSPSLSPLSTLSIRRTRTGTTGLSTVAAPSPASVGATAAARSSSISAGMPREDDPAEQPPGRDGQRQADEQQAGHQAAVGGDLARAHLRGVVEEDQRQGQLGEQGQGPCARARRASGRPSESRAPAATKAIGAVTSMRRSARAVAAKASTSTRKTTTAAVPMPAPSATGGGSP